MKHLGRICLSLAIIMCCLIGIAVNVQATEIVDSGYCGDRVTWTLDSEGTLTISGIGDMENYHNDSVFFYNKKIKKIVVKTGVESIGDYAFEGCKNLETVILPDTIHTISDRAFSYCTGLVSIRLSKNITYIGEHAFEHCESLTSISIPDGITSIYAYAFYDCCSLTSVVIPDSVTEINMSAFRHCASLKSIILPDSITSIGKYVFADCSDLTSVKLSKNITEIDAGTFQNCTSLKAINIPDKVKTVGTRAFKDCASLKTISFGKRVNTLEQQAFEGCASLEKIVIPDSITTIGTYVFNNCDSLTYADTGNGIKDLKIGIFQSCENLKTVVIGDSATSTGSDAFSGCTNLTSVKFGKNVTHIDQSAFRDCTSLKTVVIPNTVKSISSNAFYGCSNLKNVTMSNSLAYISHRSFEKCVSLETLIFSSPVEIYTEAFYNCSNLKTIYFTADAPNLLHKAFSNLTATVYYPANNSAWANIVKKQYGGTISWVASGPVITTQPKTCYGSNGSTVRATVNAIGGGLQYQWYVKEAGADKYVKSSVQTASYSCKITAKNSGRYVRCKITDQYGNSVWTNTVRLWMRDLAISTQPANKTVKDGATAKFTAKANNTNVTYQWQYRTSSTGSWKNASATGNKTATLSVSATVAKHGYQYRCKVTDNAGNKVYTKTVTLYVLGIKTQPVNKTVVEKKTAKFTVTAVGKGLTYQWQYRTSSSGSWKSTSATGNKTKTLSVSATAAKHGYQYRCKITDSAGNKIFTKTVTMYVLGIKTQPASKSVTAGTFTKFTVKATGTGLTYQWQYRTSSDGSWKSVSAASGKTATYGLTAQSRHNGYQYRCKITDTSGNVIYTRIATLTVK